MDTVTGPTLPGPGVGQLATSATAAVSNDLDCSAQVKHNDAQYKRLAHITEEGGGQTPAAAPPNKLFRMHDLKS